jgi:hypothetical protein
MNVHSADSLQDIENNIFSSAAAVFSAVEQETGVKGPYGLGLWFPHSSLQDQEDSAYMQELKNKLDSSGFYVFTLNGFPYAAFHNTRVKEQVYRPDWSTQERFNYTRDLAGLLAGFIDKDMEGTISTVPVTFGPRADEKTISAATARLMDIAAFCDLMRQDTGACVRLALEPEPGCFLEKTDDVIGFFEKRLYTEGASYLEAEYGFSPSRARDVICTHIGVCIDTVHSAVMFEDTATIIHKLNKRDIGIFKMQLGAAVGLDVSTPEDTRLLKQFADDIYLHQVNVRDESGMIRSFRDLPEALRSPVTGEWRVHFHVPLSGSFSSVPYTGVSDIDANLLAQAVHAGVSHFEVETYTLNVLPGFSSTVEDAMARELLWVIEKFKQIS